MPCSYSYLQVNFYKRFEGAVSITVVLQESVNKVEGSSPRLRVRAPVKHFFLFFIFCFRKEAGNFSRFTCLQIKSCFDVLCTCKATSLSNMARYVWRYSDDAGAIIENVYKFCMEEKKSGMKLSLNRICDRTAALTGVSRSTTQEIVEEKKKAHDEQQQPKQPPSSTLKVSLDDFDQGVVP